MPAVFNPTNPFEVIDFTDAINEIDNQYGVIRQMGIFETQGTSLTTIDFDRIANTTTLIPASNPVAHNNGYKEDRDVANFAMRLSFYRDQDYLTPQDIQDKRQPGTDMMESFNNAAAVKMTDMRYNADQTDEYLQFMAMTGALPAGTVPNTTSMYELFGLDVNDFTIDLETESNGTNIDAKLSQVKRAIGAGFKSGSPAGAVDFWLDYELYDELTNHVQLREAYQSYQNSGAQRLRDDLSTYMSWGVMDMFEHRGIRFFAYNPDFNQKDGSTVSVLSAGQGIAVPRSSRGMFRGYFGPANKLPTANTPGTNEWYAFSRMTRDQEAYEMEIQSRRLYWATKPAAIIQLT